MKAMILATAITLAFTMQAEARTYTCNGLGTAKGSTVTLDVVSGNSVKVDSDLAILDPSFSPRGNVGLARFEYQFSDEGTTEALVAEVLLQGGDRGLLKIQNRGEGFMTESYYCHP